VAAFSLARPGSRPKNAGLVLEEAPTQSRGVALLELAVVMCFAASASIGCAATPSGGSTLAPFAKLRGSAQGAEPSVARLFGAPVEATIEAEPTLAFGPSVLAAGPLSPFTQADALRCPSDMALIGDRVCVDRYEASIVKVVGGREVSWSAYESLDSTSGYRAVSRKGKVPQGYVSGRQAELACRGAGKRLCTVSEWERGCRGPENLRFPYGNERRTGVCNDDPRRAHPVIEAAAKAGIPSGSVWTAGMNLPLINQLPDSLLPAGSRESCVSAEGLYDMVGNLHEWVADADGTFRGGYYMDTSRNGDGCSYQTTAHDFGYHDYSTGFRCCRDPETIE